MRPTDEERFLFDLQGVLTLRGVLTPAQLARLNAVWDENNTRPPPAGQTESTGNILLWDPDTYCLIDHPRVTPYLAEFLGPKFRLDHDYSIWMTPGSTRGGLHSWESDREAEQNWAPGPMREHLHVLIFALTDSNPGDGGFVCIPGSHKSTDLNVLPADVKTLARDPPYVVQPDVKAGDAVYITEVLVHGSKPWRPKTDRRALIFKFARGHTAWSSFRYDLEALPGLSEQQTRILQPPYFGGRPDSIAEPRKPNIRVRRRG